MAQVTSSVAQILRVLQPLTTLVLVATQLSNTWFSMHPPLMAIGFTGFIGEGVLTSLAVRCAQQLAVRAIHSCSF